MSDSLEASMMKRIGELKAEVERLKMEQRLKAVPIEAKLMDSIAKLQTENDHLEANNDRMSREFCDLADDHCRLKQQIERLTKAGDAMATGLQGMAGERPKALADEWNEAKGVKS